MARFLAVYEVPADPEAFDRHYRRFISPSSGTCRDCAGTRWAATSRPSTAHPAT
jgi:hypothetical protein